MSWSVQDQIRLDPRVAVISFRPSHNFGVVSLNLQFVIVMRPVARKRDSMLLMVILINECIKRLYGANRINKSTYPV